MWAVAALLPPALAGLGCGPIVLVPDGGVDPQCVEMIDGMKCDDHDACTQTDTCQAGVCVGSSPVVCTALDPCHEAGKCDADTGLCSNPESPDGKLCDDGNGGEMCGKDTCQAGVCTSSGIAAWSGPDEFITPSSKTWLTLQCAADGESCMSAGECCNGCNGGVCGGGPPAFDFTTAFQAALEKLAIGSFTQGDYNTPRKYNVLYIPPGNYTLTRTVVLLDAHNVSIVGADPATTVITWGGEPGKDMMRIVDANAVKLSRITFNGAGRARIGLQAVQTNCYWDQTTTSHNTVCNLDGANPPLWNTGRGGGLSMFQLEFNDDVFEDMTHLGLLAGEDTEPYPDDDHQRGIYSGYWVRSSNTANSVVRRCTFTNAGVESIRIVGANSLQWLIQDSVFRGDGTGDNVAVDAAYLSNVQAINNLFVQNGTDIVVASSAPSTIRGNATIGSRKFVEVGGGFLPVEVSGNYIDVVESPAITGGDSHSLVVLDNFIRAPAGGDAAVISPYWITHGGNVLAPGGVSTCILSKQWFGTSAVALDGDCALSDVPPSAAAFALEQAKPGTPWNATPVKSNRSILNVAETWPAECMKPVCADSSGSCADQINGWLSGNPKNYALYFPASEYCIDKPIEVPAGLDVTIFGDGLNSILWWTQPEGAGADPHMVRFQSAPGLPAVGSIRDLYLLANQTGTSRPDGVVVEADDSAGSVVYVDSVGSSFTKHHVYIDDLDKTLVRMDQSFGGGEVPLVVRGHGAGVQGSAQTRGAVMFSGGLGSYGSMVDLQSWGKAVLVGTDQEGTRAMSLTDSGYFTMAGARQFSAAPFVSPEGCPNPYANSPLDLSLEETFRGRATFMTMHNGSGTPFPASQVIANKAPDAEVLLLGFSHTTPEAFPLNPDPAGMDTCVCWDPGPYTAQNRQMVVASETHQEGPLVGGWCNQVSDPAGEAAQLTTMLADLRSTPAVLCPPPAPVAKVRIHRIYVQGISSSCIDPSLFAGAAVRVRRAP